MPVSELRLKFKERSFSQWPISQGMLPFSEFPCNSILYTLLQTIKSGTLPIILLEPAEKICKFSALHMFAGRLLSNEFSEMLRYCSCRALPRSRGISPVKLLLLRSTKVRFGKRPKPSGIEPLSRLF
uniref:Uncharacterized protein n=1 Tax=Rhizophora mucronata TaxID=61149 RepID=A0A2P2KUN9_RHIMU